MEDLMVAILQSLWRYFLFGGCAVAGVFVGKYLRKLKDSKKVLE